MELARQQQEERDRKEKERKGKYPYITPKEECCCIIL